MNDTRTVGDDKARGSEPAHSAVARRTVPVAPPTPHYVCVKELVASTQERAALDSTWDTRPVVSNNACRTVDARRTVEPRAPLPVELITRLA